MKTKNKILFFILGIAAVACIAVSTIYPCCMVDCCCAAKSKGVPISGWACVCTNGVPQLKKCYYEAN